MRYRRLLPFVAALLCAGVPCSFADQVVYFVNGKAIMVKSIEKGEKFSILEMEGGGRIGVPTDQIERIEEYRVSSEPTATQAAVAPAPQPAPAPAAAEVAQPQTGTPNPPVPASPVAQGPGMGGKPLGEGQALNKVNPLEIGGDGSAVPRPAVPRPGMRAGQARGGQGMGGPGGIAGGAMYRPGLGAQGRRAAFAGRGGARPRPRPLASVPPSQSQEPVVEPQPDLNQAPPADEPPLEAPPEEPEQEQAHPEESQPSTSPPSQ